MSDPRSDEPRLLDALAASLREQGKLDAAEAVVRRVLQRHPRDAGAYKNLALIEADRGRVRLAEIALASARKLDPRTLASPTRSASSPCATAIRSLPASASPRR